MFLIGIALTRTGKRQDKVDKGGTKARLFFFCFRTRWADVRKYNAVAKTTSNRNKTHKIYVNHVETTGVSLSNRGATFWHTKVRYKDALDIVKLLPYHPHGWSTIYNGVGYGINLRSMILSMKACIRVQDHYVWFCVSQILRIENKNVNISTFSLLSCRCIASGNPAIFPYAV